MALTITITATEHFFRTDEGIPVRLWTGHTASGASLHAFVAALASPDDPGQSDLLHVFVAAVAAPDGADSSELQRELHEIHRLAISPTPSCCSPRPWRKWPRSADGAASRPR